MVTIWNGWYWHLGSASFIALSGALAFLSDCASAQITPDGTLPNNSIVTPQGSTSIINGGTTAGGNLFHSFEAFSVPTGGEASFNNALDIQNILTRVTGGSISNIDGLLRANGTANLFLLNPQGIIFGPNATLNIGGSFLGSTASSLNFADGTQFSATAHPTTPLLTVSVPLGLQYGANPGRIQVQGNGEGRRALDAPIIDTTVGLRVQPNQTLAIVGGDVALSGGTLKTAGGRIELGSVAGPGLVNLTPIDSGWALGYEGVPTFGDIQLSGAAIVDASGAGGGDIQVQGRRVTLTNGSQIEASTLGAEPGGTLSVTALESVEMSGKSARQRSSDLLAQAYSGATGKGGNLTVETGRLNVRDGAQVSTTTFGSGAGGTLSVTASDVVELIGTSADDRQVTSGLFADTEGDGTAGDLTIATGRLSVRDGAQVGTGTRKGSGAGGRLSVSASDVVEVIGESADGKFSSGLYTQTERQADGNAGDLTIATGRLTVRDGAQVGTGTRGTGAGGRLSVSASDVVEVIGTSADGQFASGLYAETEGDGTAGDLTIATGRLTVRDGAQVGTGTGGTGAGGTLSVSASDVVELIGKSANGQLFSGLLAETEGDGTAGDLTIATGHLFVRDEAKVTVRSLGSGNAGELQVKAGSVLLENFGELLASTASGEGGNIDLQVQDLIWLRGFSLISAEASGTGNGGNITINAPFIVAVPSENSDIIANAFLGRGGNIEITTQGIYGQEYRSSRTSESDINASSQFGVEGTVEINNPDVDPSQGLVELPAELVDTSNSFATGCSAGGENEFIITGRGGLPPNPRQVLGSNAVQVDWVELDDSALNRERGLESRVAREHDGGGSRQRGSSPPHAYNTGDVNRPVNQIVEAQGWIVDANGNVTLVATAPTAMPHSSWQTQVECREVGRQ